MEKKRAYKGEIEEGLTLQGEMMWREGTTDESWIQKWTEAMNEIQQMKGLSVLQLFNLMAPEASPQKG